LPASFFSLLHSRAKNQEANHFAKLLQFQFGDGGFAAMQQPAVFISGGGSDTAVQEKHAKITTRYLIGIIDIIINNRVISNFVDQLHIGWITLKRRIT